MNYEQFIPTSDDNSLFNRDIFNYQFNDVFFYVEDEFKEEFYFNILKKLFPKLLFDNIFPLGGKKNLIEKTKSNIGKKKTIHIADKDFDDVLNKLEEYDNLFYLKKYCIENYLVEADALMKLILLCYPNINRNEILRTINFNDIVKNANTELKYLMTVFICVQSHINQEIDSFCSSQDKEINKIKTCKQSLETFLENQYDTIISTTKLDDYIKKNLTRINTDGLSIDFNACYIETVRNLSLDSFSQLNNNHINGKYLIKMIINFIKVHYPNIKSLKNIQIVHYLAEGCKLDSLHYLRNDVHNLLKS